MAVRPRVPELIAAKWATQRKVPQIALKPDCTKHKQLLSRLS